MNKKTAVFIILFILINPARYFPEYIYPVSAQENTDYKNYLEDCEKLTYGYKLNPEYPDDIYIIACIKEAIAAMREGNGPIGVCLVNEKTGEILETGHNRQNKPYFRSDLHAEMDMLTRYEIRIKMQNSANGRYVNPRKMYEGLVLYSTLEPCIMCLARIINAGVPKVYFAAFDDSRGMAKNTQCMPAYWKDILENKMKYKTAECSPQLKKISGDIFFNMRKK